jgi:hypothetical protein
VGSVDGARLRGGRAAYHRRRGSVPEKRAGLRILPVQTL